MKRTILYALFAGVVVLNSCKKNELPKTEDQGSPVFYLKCDVNGFPVNIQAGENGYYMNSSNYRDKNDVNVYKAELKQKDCSGGNCGFSLSVLINDYKFSSGADTTTKVENGLKVGPYLFNKGGTDPLSYSANFTPETLMPGGQYQWQFGDGESDSGPTTSKKLFANTVYSISLSTDDPRGGCIISHTNVFKMGSPFQTNIRSTFTAGAYRFFAEAAQSGGQAPYRYLWDFGDHSLPSTAASPEHVYTMQDVYTVTLTTIDAAKDTCISYYQVNTAASCEANFMGTFKPERNTKALSTITILVTDPSGTVYSSSDLGQSTESKFEIISVEEFRTNEKNEPTKKLKIRFNCNLTSDIGPLTITNGEAVIAVSYK